MFWSSSGEMKFAVSCGRRPTSRPDRVEKRTNVCCLVCLEEGRGNRAGGVVDLVLRDVWRDFMEDGVGLGGGGDCRSMTRRSPALRMLFPEPIAQPSTPKDPMYFRDHWPDGVDKEGFRGVSIGEIVLVIKLFKVGSRGRFPRGLVLMSPTGLGFKVSRLEDSQDPSKYMLTALSMLPPDTSSSL